MIRWRSFLPLIALAVAACHERASVGNGPYADKVAEDVPKIEKALGVKFKTPPKLELRDRAQVREFLLGKLREPLVQKQLANQEATFKLLGMIPDTLHLADLCQALARQSDKGCVRDKLAQGLDQGRAQQVSRCLARDEPDA